MVKVSKISVVQPAEMKFRDIINRVFQHKTLKDLKAVFYMYYAPDRFGPIMRLRIMDGERIAWTEFQLDEDFTKENMVRGINEMRAKLGI